MLAHGNASGSTNENERKDMAKKPRSLEHAMREGAKRFAKSRGSTDAEYERACHAREAADAAREARQKVTLPLLKWSKER